MQDADFTATELSWVAIILSLRASLLVPCLLPKPASSGGWLAAYGSQSGASSASARNGHGMSAPELCDSD